MYVVGYEIAFHSAPPRAESISGTPGVSKARCCHVHALELPPGAAAQFAKAGPIQFHGQALLQDLRSAATQDAPASALPILALEFRRGCAVPPQRQHSGMGTNPPRWNLAIKIG